MNTTTSPRSETRLSFFRSLRGKLILVFLATSLIPLIIVGIFAYTLAQNALQAEVINKLVAVRNIKAKQITTYFNERLADIKILSNNPTVINAVNAFDKVFHAQETDLNTRAVMNQYRSWYLGKPNLQDAGNGSAYNAIHARYHPMFKEYRDAYHYTDIFLVEPHSGVIVYSVAKEEDFATSLITGPYADVSIGHVFQEMSTTSNRNATLLKDLAYYEPSKKVAAFMASPIFNQAELVGVLIFQLSTMTIDAIMQEHSGLGTTGETLLVSADDFLLRSNSRFVEENTVFNVKMDNEATRAAISGQTGVKTINYLGKSTIVAYSPLNISGIRWSLNAQIDKAEAFAAAHLMLIWMFSIICIGILLVIVVAVFFSNTLAKPIRTITHIARQLASGNLNVTVETKNGNDEIALMNEAFQQMIANLQSVIEDIAIVSQGLILGDLRVTLQAKYQGDFAQVRSALEIGLSNLQLVIEDIVQISQELVESGQCVTARAEYSGDFLPIKESLETASAKLVKITAQNQIQDWLKTGQTQLNNRMSGEQEMTELAENIITFLATYLEMPVGMLYRLEKNSGEGKDSLKLVASFAYTYRKGISHEFLVGDGLVGQAAKEQKEIVITKVPADYYVQIHSGLGQALPNTIIVEPFLYENTLKGVVELASFERITDIQREFLTQVMPNIGIAVNTAESRSRLQILLQQSQAQTEELQSQSEELQTQQEELRHTNNELEIRTGDLERQKQDIRDKNLALEKTQAEMAKAKTAIETKAQELELANKYKSEFLANMSHELRTPLNSLLILSQLLSNNKEGNLTEKQIEYAQTMYSAGSELLTLINEILDLSKVESGKIEVHTEEVALGDLIASIEQKFRHIAQDKKRDFQITLADDLPKIINTDGQRLKQIINNLLSNAFKFTTTGEVRLTLQYPDNKDEMTEMRCVQAQTIAISVTDTGIGIPQDKQEVIFKAFQQADGTTSRRYGGTGLGLSISRQLAILLGGALKLSSEEGKGSTFTLYLPEELPVKTLRPQTVELPFDASISQTSEVEPVTNRILDVRENLTTDGKSLLIIEDDRQFSDVLLKMAQEKGFKCIIAENGQTGLQLAEEYQPNAIILDVGLPQLDGWTVMERLKDNPDTRHIPVHFMSAFDQGMEAKKMGAIGHLLKPISVDELGEAFKKIEGFINKPYKNLLVIVDNEQRQQEILEIVKGGDIKITTAATITRASQELHITHFDCIILDVDVEQQSGIKMLEQLLREDNLSQIPIIIYAERELTMEEKTIFHYCDNNVTIKAVKSPGRLLDEATLFLHQVKTRLPDDKQQMLQMIHDKDAILTHKKVLIVDDDMRNSFALATVLENKEMVIVVAETGQEALEQLEKHDDITLVLMDIMMPEMNGYEAIIEIKKQSRYQKLPIIALTAKAMKGDKAKCIEAGASDYLAKPVDTEKLISLMRVWLYR